MSDIYQRIRMRREELGLSQEELAIRMGYKSRSSINKIEMGINDIPQSKVIAFARALNTTTAFLMGVDEAKEASLPSGFSRVPHMKEWSVLGATACGKPLNLETPGETVLAPEDIKADIAFRCIGDSMINARIFDGDLVFVRLKPEVENGHIAVIRVSDDYTLKKVYYFKDEGRIVLRSCNPYMSDLVYTGDELNDIEIIGEAVSFLSAVRHD